MNRNLENALVCLNMLGCFLSIYANQNKIKVPENIQVYLDNSKDYVKSLGADFTSKIRDRMLDKRIRDRILCCSFSYCLIMKRTEIPYDIRLAKVEGDSSNWPVDEKTIKDAIVMASVADLTK